MAESKIVILALCERTAGVDEAIAWHVVRYRERRETGFVYDFLEVFDNETDAVDFAGVLRAAEAAAAARG